MKYKELKYGDKAYKSEKEIVKVLKEKGFNWLINSELEKAELEIKNDTLIWHNGDFQFGKWKYGIFKEGTFNGTWESGIFEPGEAYFKGKWIDGIKLW
jgi:hypothetical protein